MASEKDPQSSFQVTDRRGQPKEETVTAPKPAETVQEKKRAEPSRKRPGSIDFRTFLLSMSTSALYHLGLVEDPHTGERAKDLGLAQQDMDILEMLREKTKGNLNSEEEKLFEDMMYELRIRFVEQAK